MRIPDCPFMSSSSSWTAEIARRRYASGPRRLQTRRGAAFRPQSRRGKSESHLSPSPGVALAPENLHFLFSFSLFFPDSAVLDPLIRMRPSAASVSPPSHGSDAFSHIRVSIFFPSSDSILTSRAGAHPPSLRPPPGGDAPAEAPMSQTASIFCH